ncbi:MAG: TIGR02757 family protein [Spirochaetota bacterium]
MSPVELRRICERAYAAFHRPRYISPDPLEIVREYDSPADREVVGLIASSLALGRVNAILAAVRRVLVRLAPGGASPAAALEKRTESEVLRVSDGFRYRFFDADQLAGLLLGIREVLRSYGSVERCFATGLTAAGGRDGLLAGLEALVRAVVEGSNGRLDRSILLPRIDRRSACKRLLLYARWMVRRDEIDPGGWSCIGPEALLVPVDAHVLTVARRLGLTTRKQATLAVTRGITDAMRAIAPGDPVRYDFALTRPGIHPMLDETAWLDSAVGPRSA